MGGRAVQDAAQRAQRLPPAEPKRKPRWRYWLPRAYCILGVLTLVATCAASSANDRLAVLVAAWAFLFMVPFLWMAMNVFVFPIKYSMLGPYARTPFPNGPPVWSGNALSTIGVFFPKNWHLPWCVYPSGLGVSILGFGRAFIPLDQIIAVNRSRRGGCRVKHASPELMSPIAFHSADMFAALQHVLERRRKRKNGADDT